MGSINARHWEEKEIYYHRDGASNFYNLSSLFKTVLINRKKDNEKVTMHSGEVRWLNYNQVSCGVLYYKSTLDVKVNFKTVNFLKKDGLQKLEPPISYVESLPIAARKKKDL